MSNARVRGIRDILKYASVELGERARGNWKKPHLGLTSQQLNRVTNTLGEFLVLNSRDPDLLDQRITKLGTAIKGLDLLLQVKNLNLPKPQVLMTRRFHDIEGDIRDSWATLRKECVALIKVNHFYKKNTSRWEHNLEKEGGFTKEGHVYGLSKGLIGPKLHEKIAKHIRKENGSRLHNAYKQWMYQNARKYPDKSTAFTVTRFLLEKPTSSHWNKVYSPGKTKLGFRKQTYKELPDHQIRFHGGRALAIVTVKEISNDAYLYLGALDGGFAPKPWPLHTVERKVKIDKKDAIFMPRTDLVAVELPWSVKYAMRHDKIFLEINPHVEKSKHADAVAFKSVQAAGGIVVKDGKVVAIDNVSGHYEPGWGLLEQAVKLIRSRRAFHPNAMVGVISGKAKETWFYPYETFLTLAYVNFTELGMLRAHRKAKTWPLPNVDNKLKKHLETGLRKQPNLETIRKYSSGLKKI